MKRSISLFLLLALLIGHFNIVSAQKIKPDSLEINVLVSGLKNIQGNLRIAIYSIRNDFPGTDDILANRIIPVKSTIEKVKFKVSEKGRYAIAILHDVSLNGKMDFNIFGYPKEKYGFSSNPGIWHRRPTFDECAFQVFEDMKIEIKL